MGFNKMNIMKNFFVLLLLMICTITIINCSDRSTNSDNTTATFSILLYDKFPKTNHGNLLTITDQGGTTFKIEDALINVRHIQIDLPDGAPDSSQF